VVALEQHPFERVFGRELGDYLRSLHTSRGVKFHLGQTATRIDPKRVHLDDGHTLNADLVVVGVGVRPVTDLAKAAGCKLDRGVVVNNQLETTVPGVFAAGDIARFPDARGRLTRVEHWAVAGQQGRVAARNILGMKQPYKAVPFFWTAHFEVPVTFVGSSENCDKVEVVGSLSSRDCMIAYREGGRITGVACIGRDRDSLLAEDALSRRDDAALENLLKGARTRVRA
jgi:NADPH-dependent 2,4-dienoyl-CoA reductase/sulfur reductase-like enzyme